jgi:hypothetical protein
MGAPAGVMAITPAASSCRVSDRRNTMRMLTIGHKLSFSDAYKLF